MSDVRTNVPIDKIYISDLCNGSISLSAEIEEMNIKFPDIHNDIKHVECSVSIKDRDDFETFIIEGEELYYIDISYDSPNGENLDYLRYIPAFYKNGTINLDLIIADTDDPDSDVDLMCDILVFVKPEDKPEWYPYDLNLRSAVPDDDWYSDEPDKKGISYAIDGIITSPSKNTQLNGMGTNTNVPFVFNMNSWVGFMPLKPVFPPYMKPSVRMGVLPPLSFRLYIKNNREDDVELSNITISFSFSYDPKATLMNIGSKNSSDFCELYCGPLKLPGDSDLYENDDEPTGDNRYLWAIIDGYDGGTDTEEEEVVKVYGYYVSYNKDKKAYENNVIALKPVNETGGTNFPPIVYKSDSAVLDKIENNRMALGRRLGNEKAWVVTQIEICRGDKFKDIEVVSKKQSDPEDENSEYIYCDPNDIDAEFFITVKLRDDVKEVTIDGGLTEDEFNAVIQKLKFFNVDVPFIPYDSEEDDTSGMIVPRSSINKIFYDTLYDNYKNSVVLVTKRDEVEPFVRIKINNNQLEEPLDWIPIYNGKPIKFNESLTRCTDGLRTRDIWFFGDKTDDDAVANVIEVDMDTDKRYRIVFGLDITEYKFAHVHKYKSEKKTEVT